MECNVNDVAPRCIGRRYIHESLISNQQSSISNPTESADSGLRTEMLHEFLIINQ